MKILVAIPNSDFDPTEASVPWSILHALGHSITFATPDGGFARGDERMLTGKGLGILAPFLLADANGRKAYQEMARWAPSAMACWRPPAPLGRMDNRRASPLANAVFYDYFRITSQRTIADCSRR